MGLRDRLKRLRTNAARIMPERVVFVSPEGEELAITDDPLDLMVADWRSEVEGIPFENPVPKGYRLKDPESVADPLWRQIDDVGWDDGA